MIDTYRIDSEKLSLHPERVAKWLRGEPVYPLYVEMSPSGGCNHRCAFCATAFIGYKQRFLDAELLKARLTEMADLGVKSVMWAGAGEPLLHKQLGGVIAHGKKAGIDQALTTNGIALTERFNDEFLEYLTWVKFSVNAGSGTVYESVHKAHHRDWDRLRENMEHAVKVRRERGLSVSLGAQIVVIPENAGTVYDLAVTMRERGLDYLVVKPYSHQEKTPTPYEGLEYQQFADVMAHAETAATETFHVIVRRRAARKVTAQDRGYSNCLATGHFWAYVEADGNVYSCSAYIGDERFRLGNINEQTFEDIWDSTRRLDHARFVNTTLDVSQCRKGCRMDPVNEYLWQVRHPGSHVNFI